MLTACLHQLAVNTTGPCASEPWCWRRLLRVPWTARRSNQSILKDISPERSLEGLMLKLKLQYFGHLRRRADSLEKSLMLGKTEGRRRRGQQRMRWLDGISDCGVAEPDTTVAVERWKWHHVTVVGFTTLTQHPGQCLMHHR